MENQEEPTGEMSDDTEDAMDMHIAVKVREVNLSYGKGKKAEKILNNLNMTVPEGVIYGLLGPSGSGKTTLLRCIVGRLRPQKGSIRVFGVTPNSPGSLLPGVGVGYMPQDIALYSEITIYEMLRFYGQLYRLDVDLIRQRTKNLLKFLDLPHRKRIIASLSGGQKRRVSLAVALIHNPPLLILDEPTVGVDPLLRESSLSDFYTYEETAHKNLKGIQFLPVYNSWKATLQSIRQESIWNRLVELTTKEQITVIITTHYVEEAREANVVGFLRHGFLLAEAPPEALMEKYSLNALEDIFLALCKLKTGTGSAGRESSIPFAVITPHEWHEKIASQMFCHNRCTFSISGSCPSAGMESENFASLDEHQSSSSKDVPGPNERRKQRFALTYWHCLSLFCMGGFCSTKNYGNLELAPLDPAIHSCRCNPQAQKGGVFQWLHEMWAIFNKNMTRISRNLPILIFQFVIPTIQVIVFFLCIGRDPYNLDISVVNHDSPNSSDTRRMSEFLIDHLSKSDTINLIQYESDEEALESVENGKTWAAIIFPKNFSTNLINRVFAGKNATEEMVEGSTIKVYPDASNQKVYSVIMREIQELEVKSGEDLLQHFNIDPILMKPFIKVERNIYGDEHSTFTEFMAPGVIVATEYIMAVGLTSVDLVTERKYGLLERAWVAGVTPAQAILAFMMSHFLTMLAQSLLVWIFALLVFEIRCKGRFILVFLLLLLVGSCGMTFGLLIAGISSEEKTSIMLTLGSFYPNLLISGVMWPSEAMPPGVRIFSKCLPLTMACDAMRAILFRSWDLRYEVVALGFVIPLAWIAFFLLASWLSAMIRK